MLAASTGGTASSRGSVVDPVHYELAVELAVPTAGLLKRGPRA